MNQSPDALRSKSVDLATVLHTDALGRRLARPPNLQAENVALQLLALQLATLPATLLDTLVHLAVELCEAGTAGLSLPETAATGEAVFRWAIMAGELAAQAGTTTPRDFSPCGITLDRHAPQLFRRPARYFTYFERIPLPIHEALVMPLYADERPLGTLWIVSHRAGKQFDREDARLMTSLANFCAAALQLTAVAAENDRLYQVEHDARTLALTALAERDSFLSSISHDLKTPLTTMRGMAQFLEQQLRKAGSPKPEPLLQGLAIIQHASATLAGMVEELVDLSQLHSGQQLELHLSPTDLVNIARQCVATAQQSTTAHTVRLQAEADECLGLWDTARVERVLTNLLSNAIKYSPAGGAITVMVATEARADRWAAATVTDQGLGIPAGDLPHVFERFYRASNVIGRVGGTGIGLAGSRQIIEQHGGTLTATSVEGSGSCFTVRLPLI